MGYSVIKAEGTASVKRVLYLFPPGRFIKQHNAVIPVAFDAADLLLNR